MGGGELSEQEQAVWGRVSDGALVSGTPRAVCSTITPFPFWGVIAAIVVFIPLALVASFFVQRQAIVAFDDRLLILSLSFWRMRIQDDPGEFVVGSGAVTREGRRLRIGPDTYHLQPGWEQAADRVVAVADGAGGASGGTASN